MLRKILGITAMVCAVSAVACGKEAAKSDSAAKGGPTMPPAHKASDAVETLAADSSKDSSAVEVTRILGYNDEQKFETDSGKRDYGPLARLYTLRRHRSDSEYVQGAMVAILEVDPAANEYKAYKHLQVEKNTSNKADVYCVFLRRETSGGQDWMGSLSRYNDADSTCATPDYKIKADSTEPITHAGNDFPDYAVRFTEGKKKWVALAVRCKDAICEIGNNKGDNDTTKSPSQSKVGRVKSWHDTQRLAKEKTGGGFDQGTSMTITPVDGLAAIQAAFYTPNGAQAATIMVHGTPQGAKYATWRIRANDSTQVWLRADSTKPDSARWQMRMITPTNHDTTTWKHVDRTKHTAGLVPGTARWKWDPKDEGIWVACEQGCCEMTGGFGFVVTQKGDTIWIPPRDSGNGRGRGGRL